MKRTYHRTAIGLALAASLALSGCANTGSKLVDSSAPTSDPRLTQGNDAKFFSTSGLTACAAAAGVGVLACAVTSSANDRTKCMVIAAIGACGVAMGANYYYDYRRSKYANTTQRLQAMSDDIKADTEKVASRTATLQQVIRDDQERIAQIQSSIQNKTVDKAKAQQEIASIDSNLVLMRKDLDGMRSKVNEYQKTAQLERQNGAGENVTEIEQEITRMNSKVVALQKEVDGLYGQRSAITLG